MKVGDFFKIEDEEFIVVEVRDRSLSGYKEITFRQVIERDLRELPDHIPLDFNGKTPLDMIQEMSK